MIIDPLPFLASAMTTGMPERRAIRTHFFLLQRQNPRRRLRRNARTLSGSYHILHAQQGQLVHTFFRELLDHGLGQGAAMLGIPKKVITKQKARRRRPRPSRFRVLMYRMDRRARQRRCPSRRRSRKGGGSLRKRRPLGRRLSDAARQR